MMAYFYVHFYLLYTNCEQMYIVNATEGLYLGYGDWATC